MIVFCRLSHPFQSVFTACVFVCGSVVLVAVFLQSVLIDICDFTFRYIAFCLVSVSVQKTASGSHYRIICS